MYEKAYGVQIKKSKNSQFSNRKYSVELSSSIQLKDLSGKPKKTFHAGSLMLKSVESLRQNATMTAREDNKISGGDSIHEQSYKQTMSKTNHQQSGTLPQEQQTLYTDGSLASKRYSQQHPIMRQTDPLRFTEISFHQREYRPLREQ